MPRAVYSQRATEIIARLTAHQYALCWDQEWATLGEVVSWFSMTREQAKGERTDWRVLLLTPRMTRTVNLFEQMLRSVPLPGDTRVGKVELSAGKGYIRCMFPEPQRLMGVMSNNLLWVVLGRHEREVWDAIDTSLVPANPNLMLVGSDIPADWWPRFNQDAKGEPA